MARISTVHRPTLMARAMAGYSRHKYGAVLDPGLVAYHNRKVLRTYLRMERGVARWNTVDPQLKALAVMKAASVLGCEWCLDFGYWESYTLGVPQHKLNAVAESEVSDLFTPLERLVMGYAAAMSATPVGGHRRDGRCAARTAHRRAGGRADLHDRPGEPPVTGEPRQRLDRFGLAGCGAPGESDQESE